MSLPNVIQTAKRIHVAGESVTIKKMLMRTDASGVHGTSGVRKCSCLLYTSDAADE